MTNTGEDDYEEGVEHEPVVGREMSEMKLVVDAEAETLYQNAIVLIQTSNLINPTAHN